MAARMSWKKPPPLVVLGGTETYLRDREIKNAIRLTAQSGRQVIRATTEAEVIDALNLTSTFGTPCLILVPIEAVSKGTLVREHREKPQEGACILIVVDGDLEEEKYPLLKEVHGAYQVGHSKPTSKKGLHDLAIKFCLSEADSLTGKEKSLDSNLAEALVRAVGTDLGTLSMELVKISALVRASGASCILLEHVKSLVRASTEIDLEPLREALKARDPKRVSAALERIKRNSPEDPIMLLLRAKGGPADLVLKWLRTALLLERGATPTEIASRTGTPEWAVQKELIPAAQRWGVKDLRRLVGDLSKADRGVLMGDPSPWISFESALLLGCIGYEVQ